MPILAGLERAGPENLDVEISGVSGAKPSALGGNEGPMQRSRSPPAYGRAGSFATRTEGLIGSSKD